jgi:hypothetical protein
MGLFSWFQRRPSRKIDPVAAGQELVETVLLPQDFEVLSQVLEETGDPSVTPEQRREWIALVLIATCDGILAGLQDHPAARLVADSLCDGVTRRGFEAEEERMQFSDLLAERFPQYNDALAHSGADVFRLGSLLGRPFGGEGDPRVGLFCRKVFHDRMMGAQRIGADLRPDLATEVS